MLRRTSTDSADTHCGYQETAAAHLLEGQGSTHSTARAVLGSACNDPMSSALLTSAIRPCVSIADLTKRMWLCPAGSEGHADDRLCLLLHALAV